MGHPPQYLAQSTMMHKEINKKINDVNETCGSNIIIASGNAGSSNVLQAGHKPRGPQDRHSTTVVHYANARNAANVRLKISKIGVWNVRTLFSSWKAG